MKNFFEFAIFFPMLMFAITVHEIGHGYVAYLFGDPTAKNAGRISLNPFRHIDPVGTILLPILLFISHLPLIGFAKPVPINFFNVKNKKLGLICISLAGPFANFGLAVIVGILIRFIPFKNFIEILTFFFFINFALGVFNLIPIPPLDGSKIIYAFLSNKNKLLMFKIEKYFIILILFSVLMFSNIFYNMIFKFFIPIANVAYILITGKSPASF